MILRRYIITQTASISALILGFLVIMLLGGRLIRYFGMAAQGGLNTQFLFTLIGYNLPYFLELIVPVAFFIGLMLALGRLYADSEMAILQSAGLAPLSLMRLLTPLIVLVLICQIGLSFWGKPWGIRSAQNLWQTQKLTQVFDLISEKKFISSQNYHLYVGKVDKTHKLLHDVIIVQNVDPTDHTAANSHAFKHSTHSISDTHDMANFRALHNNDATNHNTNEHNATDNPLTHAQKNNANTPATNKNHNRPTHTDIVILAKSAKQALTKDGALYIQLHDGVRYGLDAKNTNYNVAYFSDYAMALDIKAPQQEALKTAAKPLKNLFLDKHAEDLAEIGYRFALPWLVILAPLYAIPLSYTRPRQGRWLKLLPSVLVFVLLALSLILLKKPIEKGKISVSSYVFMVCLWLLMGILLNAAPSIKRYYQAKISSQNG